MSPVAMSRPLERLICSTQVLSTRARKDVKVEDITIQVQLWDCTLQSICEADHVFWHR
jgi:hypothetical protein